LDDLQLSDFVLCNRENTSLCGSHIVVYSIFIGKLLPYADHAALQIIDRKAARFRLITDYLVGADKYSGIRQRAGLAIGYLYDLLSEQYVLTRRRPFEPDVCTRLPFPKLRIRIHFGPVTIGFMSIKYQYRLITP